MNSTCNILCYIIRDVIGVIIIIYTASSIMCYTDYIRLVAGTDSILGHNEMLSWKLVTNYVV